MTEKSRFLPAIEGGTPQRAEALPFFRAALDEDDIEAVSLALRSGWLTLGPRTEEFERGIADYTGAEHVVAVSSCSEAMFLSLKALEVGPGDEVITSCLTFASTVHAIMHTGATPVLADIEPVSMGLDPECLERRVNERTKVILPVHFAGQACRIGDICDIARARGLAVVEDAAHSFGAEVDGKRLGNFGDATNFSFYATKNITSAEGGAVATGDADLARRIRVLSYHGMSRDSWQRYADRGSWYYEVDSVGYKCNLNDVLAALGVSQLKKVDKFAEKRAAIANRYNEKLAGSEFFELPGVLPGNTHTWHLYVVRIDLERIPIGRDRFIRALTEEKIGSSVHFIPVYYHPFFAPFGVEAKDFPVCEDYFSRCVSLPLYPDMRPEDVDDVVDALNKLAGFYCHGT
jgi:dTDP-4-amino-4,6-dideoxygalactose transaminase